MREKRDSGDVECEVYRDVESVRCVEMWRVRDVECVRCIECEECDVQSVRYRV